MYRSLVRAPAGRHRLASSRSFCFSVSRWHLEAPASLPPIFRARGTSVYPFGVPSNDPEHALFRNLDWTVADADCWAILAPSSSSTTRAALLATLRHQVRFDPLGSAGHPILQVLPPVERVPEEGGPRDRTVDDILKLVSFKTRLGHSGEFDDYTARYYSIRDEDKVTVRQHLEKATGATAEAIEQRASQLEMTTFLDLPLITLSNGQTRRARILRALLAEPELLILEEPFSTSKGFCVRCMHSAATTEAAHLFCRQPVSTRPHVSSCLRSSPRSLPLDHLVSSSSSDRRTNSLPL